MAPEVRTVFVTAPDRRAAERIVQAVVEEGLAACGTLLEGAVSIYRWEGKIERAEEVQVILKTRADAVPALQERILALHPYDVPEVLVLQVEEGHLPYLEWVREESRGRSAGA